VKKEFEALKNDVAKLNTKVQSSGRLVLNTSEELARKRKILQRIDETQTVLTTAQVCIKLLERSHFLWCCDSFILFPDLSLLFVRAYQQIEESQFYPALKTIHTLELSLGPVSDYAVAQLIGERIDPMIHTISQAVWSQFVDWAENCSKNNGDSEKVGEMAMAMARLKLLDDGYDEDEADMPRVDIRAVSRCLHVYNCLNKGEYFKREYVKCRQTHVHNMLHIKHSTKAANKGGDWRDAAVDWTKYYGKICGFFSFEDTIHRANNEEFTSAAEVEELWTICVRDVIGNLKERIPKLAPERHLALKTETDVFCAAMKDLGPLFRSAAIVDFVEQTVKGSEGSAKLKSKLVNDLKSKMKAQFKNDDFKPLRITKADDFKVAMEAMGIESQTPKDLRSFALPITKMVPETCKIIKNFFKQLAQFADRDESTNLLDASDVRDGQRTLAAELEKLLEMHVSEKIGTDKDSSSKVKKSVLTYINILWIQCVFARFVDEKFLVDECSAPPDMRMELENMLMPLRKICIETIFTSVTRGTDGLIQRGQTLEWDTTQGKPAGRMNEYMSNLCSFMQTKVIEHLNLLDNTDAVSTLASDSNIKDYMVEDRAHLEKVIFASINSSIVQMICGGRVTKISHHGIGMLREDINGLAKDLGQWLSADRRPKHLEQIFGNAEAAQLCDIVLKDEIENMQSDSERMTSYKNVEPENLVKFLEKYMMTMESNLFGFAGAEKQVCQDTVNHLRTLKRKPHTKKLSTM